jgi:hypothetical protein
MRRGLPALLLARRPAVHHAHARAALSGVACGRIPLRGEDAWVAFLPDAGVRGLRSGRQRVVLDLPPASSQCGYSADRAF